MRASRLNGNRGTPDRIRGVPFRPDLFGSALDRCRAYCQKFYLGLF